MPTEALAVHPGRSLGQFVLGQTSYHILSNLDPHIRKQLACPDQHSHPNYFIINLPDNGIRLRFRSTDQHLVLIEVTDFTKCALTYNDILCSDPKSGSSPSFRHIYNKVFGLTTSGTYLSPSTSSSFSHQDFSETLGENMGLYILSYHGVAFSFPLSEKTWNPDCNFVSLLNDTNAVSMVVFSGPSWTEACKNLWTSNLTCMDGLDPYVLGVTIECPDKITVHRDKREPFVITLNVTSLQDVLLELGPPTSDYARHHDPAERLIGFEGANEIGQPNRNGDDGTLDARFLNYPHYGIDVLIGSTTPPAGVAVTSTPRGPTVTKVILHGNVPGTYDFNSSSRCRWNITSIPSSRKPVNLDCDMGFQSLIGPLQEAFASVYSSPEEAKRYQQPTSRNRSCADSPSSSIELLSEWDTKYLAQPRRERSGVVENLQVFGFPGLIFEVANMAVTDAKDQAGDLTRVVFLTVFVP